MLEAAATAGHVHACELLRDSECPWGKALSIAAPNAGHRYVCEWLLAAGCPWSPDAVYAAARGGHADLMEWLLQEPLRQGLTPAVVPASLLVSAAEGLGLATLQQLHGQWVEGRDGGKAHHLDRWERAHILAAAAGSPTPDWRAKVQWLEVELGCPRTDDAVWRAALRPDALDRIAWLRQRGYPLSGFDRPAVYDIARVGNTAVLSYMLADGGAWPVMAAAVAEAAAEHGLLDLLETLQAAPGGRLSRAGCSMKDLLFAAVRGGQLSVVRALLVAASGGPSGGGGGGGGGQAPSARELVPEAAAQGSVQLLSWLCHEAEAGGGAGGGGGREGAPSGGEGRSSGGAGPRPRPQPLGGAALEGAVRSGCGEVMDWVADRMAVPILPRIRDPDDLCFLAARNGDLTALRWLAARLGYVPTEGVFLCCVARGCCPLPALRWMVEQQAAARGGPAALAAAAGGGLGLDWDFEGAAQIARNVASRQSGEDTGVGRGSGAGLRVAGGARQAAASAAATARRRRHHHHRGHRHHRGRHPHHRRHHLRHSSSSSSSRKDT